MAVPFFIRPRKADFNQFLGCIDHISNFFDEVLVRFWTWKTDEIHGHRLVFFCVSNSDHSSIKLSKPSSLQEHFSVQLKLFEFIVEFHQFPIVDIHFFNSTCFSISGVLESFANPVLDIFDIPNEVLKISMPLESTVILFVWHGWHVVLKPGCELLELLSPLQSSVVLLEKAWYFSGDVVILKSIFEFVCLLFEYLLVFFLDGEPDHALQLLLLDLNLFEQV